MHYKCSEKIEESPTKKAALSGAADPCTLGRGKT